MFSFTNSQTNLSHNFLYKRSIRNIDQHHENQFCKRCKNFFVGNCIAFHLPNNLSEHSVQEKTMYSYPVSQTWSLVHVGQNPWCYLCVCACVCVYVCVLVTQLCLTLFHPTDSSLPCSSDYRILQARILEWVAIPVSRGSSQPRDRTQVSCIAGRFFTI